MENTRTGVGILVFNDLWEQNKFAQTWYYKGIASKEVIGYQTSRSIRVI